VSKLLEKAMVPKLGLQDHSGPSGVDLLAGRVGPLSGRLVWFYLP